MAIGGLNQDFALLEPDNMQQSDAKHFLPNRYVNISWERGSDFPNVFVALYPIRMADPVGNQCLGQQSNWDWNSHQNAIAFKMNVIFWESREMRAFLIRSIRI